MTIRKLKEMIADLPDDMRIFADDGTESMFDDDASEFVCLAVSTSDGMAVLQTKNDIDVEEELSCMADWAIAYGWGDDELYREAVERGFTYEDFPDPELVRDRMENEYGLI